MPNLGRNRCEKESLVSVREIQKDVVDGRLLHVSIQRYSYQEVRMQIPINYYGLKVWKIVFAIKYYPQRDG